MDVAIQAEANGPAWMSSELPDTYWEKEKGMWAGCGKPHRLTGRLTEAVQLGTWEEQDLSQWPKG